MTTIIHIPTPLRPYTKKNAELTVNAECVSGALASLVESFPELKGRIFNSNNRLRPFINLYLGDVDIRQLDGLDTPLEEGSELSIVPSIAGG